MKTLKQHLDLLCCPVCHGDITVGTVTTACQHCHQDYPLDEHIINFCPNTAKQSGTTYGQKLMEDPKAVLRYESLQRKMYVRTMGKSFFSRLNLQYEADYLQKQISNTPPGKILDLACGSGIATRFLTARFGNAAVIGLDISHAMLSLAREKSPKVLFLRSQATQLPILSNSVGAITCWDALQALPDHKVHYSKSVAH